MSLCFQISNDFLLSCKKLGKQPLINRWALHDFVLFLVEKYGSLYRKGFGVSKSFKGCCKSLVMQNTSLLIKQAESFQPYKPSNLFTCNTRTCVTCGYKLALGDVAEALRGIQEYAYSTTEAESHIPEARKGRSVIQICLTCSHTKGESLRKVKDDNMRARKLFWDDRTTKGLFKEVGLDALCIANESPYGDNGWCFHPHIMAFCNSSVDNSSLESALTPIWKDKVKKVGRKAITGPCLSVDGGEAIKTYLSKQAFELGFGNYSKDRGGYSHLRTPFHILYNCAEWYCEAVKQYGNEENAPSDDFESWLSDVLVYLEWIDTMRGTRFFRWSPSAKKIFPWLASDEEKIKDYDQNGRNIMNILNGHIFWRSLSVSQKFQLQRYGIGNDFDGLAGMVSSLGFDYIDERNKKEC